VAASVTATSVLPTPAEPTTKTLSKLLLWIAENVTVGTRHVPA